jgi:FkbM family methyltransferase
LRGPEVKALSHHKAAEFRANGEIYGISLIGFDGPEEQGVWSRHKNVKVFLPIGLDAGGEGISVWFEITPYCPGEYQQELSIALEDGRRCDFCFGARAMVRQTIAVQIEASEATGLRAAFELSIPSARTPAEVEGVDDHRELGIMLHRIVITPLGREPQVAPPLAQLTALSAFHVPQRLSDIPPAEKKPESVRGLVKPKTAGFMSNLVGVLKNLSWRHRAKAIEEQLAAYQASQMDVASELQVSISNVQQAVQVLTSKSEEHRTALEETVSKRVQVALEHRASDLLSEIRALAAEQRITAAASADSVQDLSRTAQKHTSAVAEEVLKQLRDVIGTGLDAVLIETRSLAKMSEGHRAAIEETVSRRVQVALEHRASDLLAEIRALAAEQRVTAAASADSVQDLSRTAQEHTSAIAQELLKQLRDAIGTGLDAALIEMRSLATDLRTNQPSAASIAEVAAATLGTTSAAVIHEVHDARQTLSETINTAAASIDEMCQVISRRSSDLQMALDDIRASAMGQNHSTEEILQHVKAQSRDLQKDLSDVEGRLRLSQSTEFQRVQEVLSRDLEVTCTNVLSAVRSVADFSEKWPELASMLDHRFELLDSSLKAALASLNSVDVQNTDIGRSISDLSDNHGTYLKAIAAMTAELRDRARIVLKFNEAERRSEGKIQESLKAVLSCLEQLAREGSANKSELKQLLEGSEVELRVGLAKIASYVDSFTDGQFPSQSLTKLEGSVQALYEDLTARLERQQYNLSDVEAQLRESLRGIQRIDSSASIFAQRQARRPIRLDKETFAFMCASGPLLISARDEKFILHLTDQWGAFEQGTTQVVSRILKPGDTFVDVGAHVGWYTLLGCRLVGSLGKVFAFEPFMRNAELLKRTLFINDVAEIATVYNTAVGRTNRHGKLYLGEVTAENSMLPLGRNAKHRRVKVVSLDNVLPETTSVRLVKIDAEGSELEVLAGATDVLRRSPECQIIAELGQSHLLRGGISVESWFSSFEATGRQAFAIDERTGDCSPVTPSDVRTRPSVNVLWKP